MNEYHKKTHISAFDLLKKYNKYLFKIVLMWRGVNVSPFNYLYLHSKKFENLLLKLGFWYTTII